MLRPLSTFACASILISLLGCSSKEERVESFYDSGVTLYKAEEFSKARLEFKNALQIDPKLPDAHYHLALIAEREKDWREVYKQLYQTAELDKQHIEARLKLAQFHLLSKDYLEARKYIDETLALDPENGDAYAVLATIEIAEGRYEAALELTEKAEQLEAGYIKVVGARSLAYRKLGKVDRALAVLDDALARTGNDVQVRLLRLDLFTVQKMISGAEAELRSLIAEHPDNAAFYRSLTSLYISQRQYDSADKLLSEYIKQNPEDISAQLQRVEVLSLVSLDQALEVLDGYIASTPDSFELQLKKARLQTGLVDGLALTAKTLESMLASFTDQQSVLRIKAVLADVYLGQGEQQKSARLLKEVLSVDANNEPALLVRARHLLAQGNIEDAITDLRVVLRNNPESETALVMLGQAYINSGSADLADDTFRDVLSINPSNIDAVVPVAGSLLKKKDLERSESVISKALQKSPDNSVLMAMLAQVKLMKRDADGAESIVKELESASGETAFSAFMSGRIFVSQGMLDLAIVKFQRALELNPQASRALDALIYCYMKQGEKQGLFDYLEAFIKKNPNMMDSYSALAEVTRQTVGIDEAIKVIDRGLVQSSDWVKGYVIKTTYFTMKGDMNAAETVARKGLEAVPDSVGLMMILAENRQRAGDNQQAEALYQRIIDIDSKNLVAINNLANLLVDHDESPERIATAAGLIDIFKGSTQPYFLDTYGWVKIKQEKYEEAAKALKSVVELEPREAIFRYHYALALVNTGKSGLAAEQLNVASELKPSPDLAAKIELLRPLVK